MYVCVYVCMLVSAPTALTSELLWRHRYWPTMAGREVAAAVAWMCGCVAAVVVVQKVFPRKVIAVHRDKNGNLVDPHTGKPL
jgi:hypothetical protein